MSCPLYASVLSGKLMVCPKYAVSGMIPVVGGAVSGALSTLASGIKLLSGIMGALSVASLTVLMGTPLLMLLLYRVCILCAASFAEFCGSGNSLRMINAPKFSLDSMIALYTTSALVYIIEIVMFMKGGVSQ